MSDAFNLLHSENFCLLCSALNTCSVELLLKVGTLLPELAVHEKTVDHFIELLRKDQLDENTSTDPLEKSISYFQVGHLRFNLCRQSLLFCGNAHCVSFVFRFSTASIWRVRR